MARSGVLGQHRATVSATMLTLYSCPSGSEATGVLIVCNRGSVSRKIKVALLSSFDTAVTDKNYIQYDTTVSANDSFAISGIVLSAGEAILTTADSTDISFTFTGLARDA